MSATIPAPDEKARSVICLPGLTRNARDFHQLATYLSTHPQKPRNVYCVDYRGRGRSQYDRNWRNYIPFIELIDALDFLTAAGPAPRRHRRHLARRHHRHDDGGAQPHGHGPGRAQRYRPGDRDARACAHHGLCRAHAGAEELARRRHASCAR